MNRFLLMIVVCSMYSQAAHALSPAAIRGLRNAEIAINSVQLLPELRCGPIPAEKMQTAKNLLRDLDSALIRGQRELSRMSDADRADPSVLQMAKILGEYMQFRNDLKISVASGRC